MDMCEMKYSLVYNFGYKDKSNLKAVLGTIFHRVMQVLGDKKIAIKNGKKKVINDDIPSYTLKQCDDLDKVTEDCFKYYTAMETTLVFDDKNLRDVKSWVKKAVEYDDGKLDPRNQDIETTEKYFEIEIDKPWAKYSYDIGNSKIEGHLTLKGTIDVIIKEEEEYFQVLDYKGLPVDTPIPTPNGWSTMGDLAVGDVVFDRFGKQTKVTAKSEAKFKECYEITFDDTSKVICDDEHKWKLSSGITYEIKKLKVGDEIDMAMPIDCDENSLLDPYTFGLNFPQNPDKKIPISYLRASYLQRLDLFRGLLESTGFTDCENLNELFLTLGKKAYKTRVITSIEKVGVKYTQCITVDSPDSTYLCTHSLIPTHNSGKRLNWATGKEKTQECLEKDFQLLLYYYALKNLYPTHKFYVSIYYVNDGGLFDIIFDESDYIKAENMIKQKFTYINSVEIPRQLSAENSHWKCKSLCAFSKPTESGKTVCQEMHSRIKDYGYLDTLSLYGDLTKINAYGSGGGRVG